MNRRRPSLARKQHGFLLIALLALLAMGGLYFFISNLTPEAIATLRKAKTDTALVQAREALIGYALQFRDLNPDSGGKAIYMYGYLPLPDLGSSRINTTDPSCKNPLTGKFLEGCDAANFGGNHDNFTVIGRFPWRKLGIEPLRDGWSECLWYAVSGSHQDYFKQSPMNWDTLGQLDLLTASGGAELVSQLATKHDRPIAVIFSPGPILPGQDRSTSETDDVSQCGGNYTVNNYLDPGSVAMGTTKNYFTDDPYIDAGIPPKRRYASPNPADVSAPGKLVKLSTQGPIYKTDSQLTSSSCQTCELVANDQGLALTSDMLFGALRKSSNFRTDINSMLDRMVGCLRDQIANDIATGSSSFLPVAIPGFTPNGKSAGRVLSNTCYDDNQSPLNYFSNYWSQVFVARPSTGTFNVSGDNSCSGVLIFAGQRGPKNPVPSDAGEYATQLRTTDAVSVTNPVSNDNWLANYLEGTNLNSIKGTGTVFTGPAQFDRISTSQPAEQDILRCIPAGASMSLATSQPLADAGFGQLVAYDTATRTLTLGKENVTTGFFAPGTALFGCAWLADSRSLANGFRSYFSFQFKKVGTSVGGNGFVFAIADAVNNSLASCGAAGSHLGYSGDNGSTPKITFPKIGIEFDQSRNLFFPTTSSGQRSTSAGRNDPCYTCGTGTFDTHAAIVYWGHESANLTDSVIDADYDDNVHGFPTAAALAGNLRPPPTNPAVSSPGLKPVNLKGYPLSANDSRLFYVRIEVKPTRNVNTSAAELSNSIVQTEVWIESDSNSVNQIAALKNTTRPMTQLYPGYNSTINDTSVIYDVSVEGSSCNATTPCPATQACGTDNVCYRPALQTLRLGFTGSQRTSDQEVKITDFFTTWLP